MAGSDASLSGSGGLATSIEVVAALSRPDGAGRLHGGFGGPVVRWGQSHSWRLLAV